MRIAWFTHRYHPVVGGAENYGRAMVRRFIADGSEADVFTSDAHDLWSFVREDRPRVDAPSISVDDGAVVRRFAARRWFGQRHVGRLLSYLPIWPIQCRYESFMPILPGIDRVRGDYDAVFAVGFPYTIFSHSAYLTARSAGAPLILTPFLHLATPGDALNRSYSRPHQVRLLKEADAVVVQTGLEADAVANWGVDRARIVILGMAVDRDQVTGGDRSALRSRLHIPRDRVAIGHLATLDPNKGTIDLVKATMALNARREGDPVHLILAGPSTPAFESFTSSLPAVTSRWLSRIGPLPMEDRAEFFAALDVFAMPSRADSFGIVFLEAWANGLPVVGARAGGVAEVIADGRDGHLVAFGDVDRLRSVLESLADDPASRRAMGDRGRVKVARGYSWDDRYRTIRDRVDPLVAKGKGKRIHPGSTHRPSGLRPVRDETRRS